MHLKNMKRKGPAPSRGWNSGPLGSYSGVLPPALVTFIANHVSKACSVIRDLNASLPIGVYGGTVAMPSLGEKTSKTKRFQVCH